MAISTPNISVIMPTFNREKYVAQAIKSIIAQTYKDFEFIIIDDGSTDNSSAIIEEYAVQDNRIKYIKQSNQGPANARNTAIKHSRGQYIALMDDDDISVEDRLEKQIKFLEGHPQFGACICFYTKINTNRDTIGHITVQNNILQQGTNFLKYTFTPTFILGPSSMVKTSVMRKCGGYRTSPNIIEDLDFTFRFQEQFSAGVVGEYLYKYTDPMSSFGNSITTKNPAHYIKILVATFINNWYRRNKQQDLLELNKSLEEIIKLLPNLPKITRECIPNGTQLRHLAISIKQVKHISTEDVIATMQILKHIESNNTINKLSQKVKKYHCKKLILQGKWNEIATLLKN